jgi:hypothetical protein
MFKRQINQLNQSAKQVSVYFDRLKQLNDCLISNDGSNDKKLYDRQNLQNMRNQCLRRLEWELNDLFSFVDTLHKRKLEEEDHSIIEAHHLMAKRVKQYIEQSTHKNCDSILMIEDQNQESESASNSPTSSPAFKPRTEILFNGDYVALENISGNRAIHKIAILILSALLLLWIPGAIYLSAL